MPFRVRHSENSAAAILSAGTITAALVALAPAVTASAAQASAAQVARRPVIINGIFYNSPGADNRSNASLNHEWVRLLNTTGHSVNLTGWQLRDAADHVFTFGSYRLGAHGSVRIHTGHGQRTWANRYWNRSSYIWNNNGDTATLKNAAGAVRARCTYSDPPEQRAFTSC